MSKGMSKDVSIKALASNWDMAPEIKKELIYSLLGHRMKFTEIAAEIGQSVQDVKQAWKGIVVAAPGPEVFSTTVENVDLEAVADKVAEVAPIKAIYTKTSFDEILSAYRHYIGW